jgi:4-hydroxybenzoate polyprenyltransferase
MPTKAIALALATHPGPSIAVTAVFVALGVGVGLDGARLVLLGLAVLLQQASVGLSNDWLDAGRDRATGRRDKPVALGWVSEKAARNAAFAAATLAMILTAPLGILAMIAHGIFLVSAWTYNSGLKSTPLSVLPYLVSFGLLPLIVTFSLQPPALAAWWTLGMGALLGVAAHFANVLPDLEDDRRTGVRGLPHRIGVRGSGLVICVSLVGAAVLAVVGPGGTATVARWIVFALTLAIAAAIGVLVLTRPPRRLLFRLIIAAALLSVLLLVSAGEGALVIPLWPR